MGIWVIETQVTCYLLFGRVFIEDLLCSRHLVTRHLGSLVNKTDDSTSFMEFSLVRETEAQNYKWRRESWDLCTGRYAATEEELLPNRPSTRGSGEAFYATVLSVTSITPVMITIKIFVYTAKKISRFPTQILSNS